jgi:hypothetical protein
MATGTSSIFQQTDDDDPGEGQGGQGNSPQQSQSKNDPPPPTANLSDADKEALQKREAFYADWKDADPDARAKKIRELGTKHYNGVWDEAKLGDPSKFDITKQMTWLMSFATAAGVIPPDPTVKK